MGLMDNNSRPADRRNLDLLVIRRLPQHVHVKQLVAQDVLSSCASQPAVQSFQSNTYRLDVSAVLLGSGGQLDAACQGLANVRSW